MELNGYIITDIWGTPIEVDGYVKIYPSKKSLGSIMEMYKAYSPNNRYYKIKDGKISKIGRYVESLKNIKPEFKDQIRDERKLVDKEREKNVRK